MSDLLTVSGLTYFYPDQPPVLRDLSFALPEKGVTMIEGPNGAGKSTLLNLMSGLLSAERAEYAASWRGGACTFEELRGRVGFATTVPQLFDGLSAHENIDLAQVVLDETDEFATEARELCLDLGLNCLDRDVALYSSGMRQKLWLAITLARRVPLVLLDEPFNTLDIGSCEVLAQRLRGSRHSVVLVAHQVPAGLVVDHRVVLNPPPAVEDVVTAPLDGETRADVVSAVPE